jgi:acyl dehydratase
MTMESPVPLCLEDLAVGQRYAGRTVGLDGDAIRAFAGAFDPQPFHLDEAAAQASVFGRLVASGWHTMALTTRNQRDEVVLTLVTTILVPRRSVQAVRPQSPSSCGPTSGP